MHTEEEFLAEGGHYHLEAGTVGALPDGEGTCYVDLDVALEAFKDECQAYVESGQNVEVTTDHVTRRPARRDEEECWAFASIAPIDYLQVVRCADWDRCELYREAVENSWDTSGVIPGEPA